MITFKEYLLESSNKTGVASWSTPVSDDEMASLLLKHCSQALKSGAVFFRGGPKTALEVGKTGQEPRRSANTYNYYTWFIDNSEAWKDYPKRGNSFVCSTEPRGAYKKSKLSPHLVVPFDNTVYAVAPSYDFWFAFEETIKPFDSADAVMDATFNMLKSYYMVEQLKTAVNDENVKLNWNNAIEWVESIDNAKDFFKYIRKITPEYLRNSEKLINDFIENTSSQLKVLIANRKSEEEKLVLKQRVDTAKTTLFLRSTDLTGLIIKHGSLYNAYGAIFKPSSQMMLSDVRSAPGTDKKREVWFSGECAFISLHVLDIENYGYNSKEFESAPPLAPKTIEVLKKHLKGFDKLNYR